MSVRRDKRTGGWIFQARMKLADGTRTRIFGTPGVPGPYQDLPRTYVGAQEAERRAISEVLNGTPLLALVTEAKEVQKTTEAPKKATEVQKTTEAPKKTTIREHAKVLNEKYKPGSKPSEKREKKRVLNTHLLPFFGDKTIESLKQTDVDTYAQSELDRGMAIKTVNNQLAVLSTLIKYTTGEKSKLRFKLDGMAGELTAVATEDVEKLLVASGDERLTAMLLLASEAGLRAAEIRGLHWTDIKSGQITVRRTLDKMTNEPVAPKHNKSRTVPMSGRLSASLTSLPRRGLWVLAEADGSPITYDRMIDTVHAVYAKAEVARPPKALHCLRHTFGTVMARKVPLPVLQRLMGHADVQTTLRYIDVNEDDKREAIALVFGAPASEVASGWQASGKRDGSAEGGTV